MRRHLTMTLLFAALRYDIVSDLSRFKAYGGLRYKF